MSNIGKLDEAKLETLRSWVAGSKSIVFLGGAGVSTASGIPDFRGKNGLDKQERETPMEVVLSHDFMISEPEEFYRQMAELFDQGAVRPNAAHEKLAELEREEKLDAVITQNIDGLHQAAGSKKVLELHGNADRYHCMRCGHEVRKDDALAGGVPHCLRCGGLVRPDVVLYGESLDQSTLTIAVQAIREADLMIVGGTSLTVYPAAGLIDYFNGDHLVIINETPTPGDAKADLVISDPIAEVFEAM